jgi:hypothetical protein
VFAELIVRGEHHQYFHVLSPDVVPWVNSDGIERHEVITPKNREENNWTIVSPIPWYRSTYSRVLYGMEGGVTKKESGPGVRDQPDPVLLISNGLSF